MKFIRKINEAVKLPTKQNKQVSLNDIRIMNQKYIKEQIHNIMNEAFKNASNISRYSITTDDLKLYCLHYSDPLDFSPGISIKYDDTNIGKYIVYLRIANDSIRSTNTNPCHVYLALNTVLDNICSRNSDIISDIKLINISVKPVGFNTQINSGTNIDGVQTMPFPESVSKIWSDFKITLSSSITDDQWKNIIKYTQRFDDVVESVDIVVDVDEGLPISNCITILKKVINDVLPKFKFKFNSMWIDDYHIMRDIVLKSTIENNELLNIFNQQNISKIAYDFDKFYVSLDHETAYVYITNNAEFYAPKYTQGEKKIIYDMFHDKFSNNIAMYALRNFTTAVEFGYSPKLNDICFICAKKSNTGKVLSSEKMIVPFDDILNYIIDNANDPDAVTGAEIINGLGKVLHLRRWPTRKKKHVDEAVKLPMAKRSNISLDDISRANAGYLKNLAKQEAIHEFNTYLNDCELQDVLLFPRVLGTDGSYDYSPSIIDVVHDESSTIMGKTETLTIAICWENFTAGVNNYDSYIIDIPIRNELICIIKLNQILNKIIEKSKVIAKINVNIILEYDDITCYKLCSGRFDNDTATKLVHDYTMKPHSIERIKFTNIGIDNSNDRKRFQEHNVDIMQFIGRCANQFDDNIMLYMSIKGPGVISTTDDYFKQLCDAGPYAKFDKVFLSDIRLKSFIFDNANKQKILALAKNPETFFIRLKADAVHYWHTNSKIYDEDPKSLVICWISYVILSFYYSSELDTVVSKEILYRPIDSSFHLIKHNGTYININDVTEEIVHKAKINSIQDTRKTDSASIKILIQILKNA